VLASRQLALGSRWARAELAMFENNPDLLEDRLENIWKIDSNIANVREVV
jgi:hypothetical protein